MQCTIVHFYTEMPVLKWNSVFCQCSFHLHILTKCYVLFSWPLSVNCFSVTETGIADFTEWFWYLKFKISHWLHILAVFYFWYSDIPPREEWTTTPDASYLYYCDNETVNGKRSHVKCSGCLCYHDFDPDLLFVYSCTVYSYGIEKIIIFPINFHFFLNHLFQPSYEQSHLIVIHFHAQVHATIL